MKKIFVISLVLLSLILSACGSSTSTPAGGNYPSNNTGEMSPVTKLALGTLKLDGTDYFDFHHTPNDTLDKIESKRLNQSAAAYTVFTYLAAELSGDYRAKPAR